MKKLNIIDVFIILLVILTIAGVGTRIGIDAYLNEKNNSEYNIILSASGVDEQKKNSIREGDEIFFEDDAKPVGKIFTLVFSPVPEKGDEGMSADMRYDAVIQVEVRGRDSQKGFMLEDGRTVYVGQSLKIVSEGYEGEITVMGINAKNE